MCFFLFNQLKKILLAYVVLESHSSLENFLYNILSYILCLSQILCFVILFMFLSLAESAVSNYIPFCLAGLDFIMLSVRWVYSRTTCLILSPNILDLYFGTKLKTHEIYWSPKAVCNTNTQPHVLCMCYLTNFFVIYTNPFVFLLQSLSQICKSFNSDTWPASNVCSFVFMFQIHILIIIYCYYNILSKKISHSFIS